MTGRPLCSAYDNTTKQPTLFDASNAVAFLQLAWNVFDNVLILPVWILLTCDLVLVEKHESKLHGMPFTRPLRCSLRLRSPPTDSAAPLLPLPNRFARTGIPLQLYPH